jgi:hypothetical protein
VSGAARAWLRGGLVLLALYLAVIGVWMLAAPRSFYDDVPTVSMYPPNEHLVSDLGAFYAAFAVLLAVAAVSLARQLTTAALAAYLVAAVAAAGRGCVEVDPFTGVVVRLLWWALGSAWVGARADQGQ